MITRAKKYKQMEMVERNRIFLYHLTEAEKEIKKGNENVRVLYDILIKEINSYNGTIKRKYNKIRNLPTVD